ncbi:RDD family protein [Caulobacter segnis]
MTDHTYKGHIDTGHAWTDTRPHPWRRLLGRLLDVVLLGYLPVLALYYALSLGGLYDAADQLTGVLSHPLMRWVGMAVSVVAALPLSALLIAWTGGSPGKWLAGVRVQRPDGRRLDLAQAFRREANVAFAGLALGFPLISLYTVNRAYQILEKRGVTSWDQDRFVVTHRPAGALQVVLMIVCVLALIALMAPNVVAGLARSSV